MTLVKTKSRLRGNGDLSRRSLFPTTSLLEDFMNFDFPNLNLLGDVESRWLPSANIKQDDKKFIVEMSVPGLTKNDIHVEIDDNNMLCISGEKKEQSEEETENYTRREFSHGEFSRTFELPSSIKEDKISAKCSDGILTVELPKKEGAFSKSKVKEIKIA